MTALPSFTVEEKGLGSLAARVPGRAVVGERVAFRDARGNLIRGRVTRSGHSFGVVFQRGWLWSDGTREPRSGYQWAFDLDRTMLGHPEIKLTGADQ